MTIANSSKIVTFQVNRELVNDAMEVLKEKNLSLSSALRLFLKNVAVTNEVDLLSEEELEKEYLFRQLQAEVQESYAKIEAGNYLTDEDVVTRYGL
ncbi:type II toxin-antitoxin system RelB/ParD family antitoxin [Streptococcus pseudopneumoniae]